LGEITKAEVPAGVKRLNIIIGTALFGPSVIKSEVFGKTVESVKWDLIETIPSGATDIGTTAIRIHSDGKTIRALEILAPAKNDAAESDCVESVAAPKAAAAAPANRELHPIPRGE
jgi:hypothetical protein